MNELLICRVSVNTGSQVYSSEIVLSWVFGNKSFCYTFKSKQSHKHENILNHFPWSILFFSLSLLGWDAGNLNAYFLIFNVSLTHFYYKCFLLRDYKQFSIFSVSLPPLPRLAQFCLYHLYAVINNGLLS